MATSGTHLLLFPFPAKGHLSGFLAFAAAVHRLHPDTAITLLTTPRNALTVRALLPSPESSTPIRIHTLPFPPEDGDSGLPAFADVAPPDYPAYYAAYDTLGPAIDQYLSSSAGTDGGRRCFVSDIILPWSIDVAHKHGAFHACLLTCGAFGSALFALTWIHLPRKDGDELSIPGHAGIVLHRSQLPRELAAADAEFWIAFHNRRLEITRRTDALLLNTVEEFDGVGLGILRRELTIPICPIGPLLRRAPAKETSDVIDVFSWLDARPPSSVLYVAFGSLHRLRANEMLELAAGVVASGKPFIWAITPPEGAAAGEDMAAWLPDGFAEAAEKEKRGLLLRRWAPQIGILAHPSTGVFLSHCGWNSVLESVSHGVPIIGWPLGNEQTFNAKMLVEQWGVCVEVARGHGTAGYELAAATVAGVVEEAMGGGEKAAAMRRRAAKLKSILGRAWSPAGGGAAGSSDAGLDEFFRAVQSHEV